MFSPTALDLVLNASLRDEGYAFFLEVVEAIYQADLTVTEVPIEFLDRVYGSSKIPRAQIMTSMGVLIALWRHRLTNGKRPAI